MSVYTENEFAHLSDDEVAELQAQGFDLTQPGAHFSHEPVFVVTDDMLEDPEARQGIGYAADAASMFTDPQTGVRTKYYPLHEDMIDATTRQPEAPRTVEVSTELMSFEETTIKEDGEVVYKATEGVEETSSISIARPGLSAEAIARVAAKPAVRSREDIARGLIGNAMRRAAADLEEVAIDANPEDISNAHIAATRAEIEACIEKAHKDIYGVRQQYDVATGKQKTFEPNESFGLGFDDRIAGEDFELNAEDLADVLEAAAEELRENGFQPQA